MSIQMQITPDELQVVLDKSVDRYRDFCQRGFNDNVYWYAFASAEHSLLLRLTIGFAEQILDSEKRLNDIADEYCWQRGKSKNEIEELLARQALEVAA